LKFDEQRESQNRLSILRPPRKAILRALLNREETFFFMNCVENSGKGLVFIDKFGKIELVGK